MSKIKNYRVFDTATNKYITMGTDFKGTDENGNTYGIYKDTNKKSVLNYVISYGWGLNRAYKDLLKIELI